MVSFVAESSDSSCLSFPVLGLQERAVLFPSLPGCCHALFVPQRAMPLGLALGNPPVCLRPFRQPRGAGLIMCALSLIVVCSLDRVYIKMIKMKTPCPKKDARALCELCVCVYAYGCLQCFCVEKRKV